MGIKNAPKLIREARVLFRLKKEGNIVTDFGDLEGQRGGEKHFNMRMAEKVAGILSQGQVSVTLGGDHSTVFGTLAGSLQHDPDTVVV